MSGRRNRHTAASCRDQPVICASSDPGAETATESVPSSMYVRQTRWACASSIGGEATRRKSERYTPVTLSCAIAWAIFDSRDSDPSSDVSRDVSAPAAAARSRSPSSSPMTAVSYQPEGMMPKSGSCRRSAACSSGDARRATLPRTAAP